MTVLDTCVSTGSSLLDKALDGGLVPGKITLIYGEAETGKTTLTMQCAVNCSLMGLRTLYVDTEQTFSPERLCQIASDNFRKISDSIIIMQPTTFDNQAYIIDNIEKYISGGFGLIIFDTITALYRSEIFSKKSAFNLNRELNRQVATLSQIAKTSKLSVLLVSQVRSTMNIGTVTPVATRVLRFWSDSILSLSRFSRRSVVRASVEKKPDLESTISFCIIIKDDGIHNYNL